MPEVETLAADVVVLGSGPAGMAALAAAADEGASVVVLEAMDHIGGNAVWSTGYLAFVDSAMQREQDIADDEETFVADARAMVEAAHDRFGVEWDEDLVRLFARESAETSWCGSPVPAPATRSPRSSPPPAPPPSPSPGSSARWSRT